MSNFPGHGAHCNGAPLLFRKDNAMHRYTLRDDLSFCSINERLVFLDVGNDRYFRLPEALEHSCSRTWRKPRYRTWRSTTLWHGGCW